MAELTFDAEMSAEERGGELCDQFLGRIGFRTKAVGENAIEARLVSAPMAEFVQRGCVISFEAFERISRRQLDHVERGDEAGPAPAIADVSAGAFDEPLRSILQRRTHGFFPRGDALGEAFDLRNVEDGVGAQHVDLLLRLVFLDSELAGEHDVRAGSPFRTFAPTSSACLKVIHA